MDKKYIINKKMGSPGMEKTGSAHEFFTNKIIR